MQSQNNGGNATEQAVAADLLRWRSANG